MSAGMDYEENRVKLRNRPLGFGRINWNFLAAAKKEGSWYEAAETVKAQGEITSLKALKRILL